MKSFIMIGMLGSAVAASGALITWNGDGDGISWTDGDNWDLNQVPAAADNIVINSATVDFNTTFSSSLANGQVVIDLNSSQLNLTGGAMTFQNGTSGTSPVEFGSTLAINISGGSHNLRGRVGSGQFGTIRVTGSNPTINMYQSADFRGTYDFVFDANG